MNRKFLPLLAALFISGLSASALDATVYASQSRLASGKWVKIRTTQEGIYQLTYSQLQQLGFDDPTKVAVYGYGATALTSIKSAFRSDFPDDIVPMATHHTADGRILFFGQGDAYIRTNSIRNYGDDSYEKVRTHYDTASYYFLSDAEGAFEAPVISSPAPSSQTAPLYSHIHLDFIEPEVQNPSNGGAVFHGEKLTPGTTVPHEFEIKDFLTYGTDSVGSFYYRYGVQNKTSTTVLSIELPEQVTEVRKDHSSASSSSSTITFTNAYGRTAFTYKGGAVGKSEKLSFGVKIPAVDANYVAEDFVMLRYPRANRLDDSTPFLVMNFPTGSMNSGQKVVFSDVNSDDLMVWGIDGFTPQRFKMSYTGNEASIVLNGSNRTAVAFRPSLTFGSPEIVGEVANQNIHGCPTPDMLIITIREMLPEAQELAALHRQYQGMDVMVAVHDDIYNEFSSGAQDAMAYRRLAKMFYDRDPEKFRFLMFLGPTYYDNRSISTPKTDRLVCYEQDDPALYNSSVTNYAADVYFGMLSDSYKHSNIHFERCQINVGRVSCLSPGQAATYVAKVRDRFENPLPAEVYNHVLLSAGNGDNTKHSQQANEVMDSMRVVNSAISVSPIYVEAYNKVYSNEMYDAVTAALNRGAGMMTYIGHGSPTSIASWDISKAANTRYTYAPFVMFSSCDQFAFDHSHNGLAETMMLIENGGALGGVAAVRSVYIEHNQKTCIPVSVAYASSKYGDTFGDVFRRSRDMILDDYAANKDKYSMASTTFRNILSYNLAGDPAIPIGVPEFAASLDKVGETPVADGITVNPFESNSFSGKILREGALAADFNGKVRIEVLEGEYKSLTNNIGKESNYTPNTITHDSDVLAIGYGSVTNGEFTVDLSIPSPAYPTDGVYRALVTATSDNGNAIGFFNNLKIGQFDADKYEETDFDAPQIIEFYANDPSFQSGDEVTAFITVHAVINPSSSGLNAMTANVGTRTRLTVDGISPANNLEGFLKRREDGNLDLEVPMSQLSDGAHSIELCVVNTVGIAARSTIEVIVSQRNLQPEVTVAELPASDVATIDVTGTDMDYSRLIITDARGETVFSKENVSFPFEWNLKDNKNNDVQDGLYRVSVLVQNDRDYGSTPAADLTVLRSE